MWPFKKNPALRESRLFENLTDWHSHILPGVDDGIKTLDDSLAVLELYDELGVEKVWLTPHIMEDCPNTTEELRKRFAELKESWKGNVKLALASENMLDALFEERMESGDLLPIGDDGRHLLVETSYFNPPMGMEQMLRQILCNGFFPVLAHPERYIYMSSDDYRRLKDMGLLFQLNFVSLTGGYGEPAQKKAEWLLSERMVDMIGSDLHNFDIFKNLIEKPIGRRSSLDDVVVVSQNHG